MAVEFITSTRTSTLTAHFEDVILVTDSGKIRVTSTDGIVSGTSGTDYQIDVIVDGGIFAGGTGVLLNDTDGSGNGFHEVIISSDGKIVAAVDGVQISGDYNSIQSAGDIIAAQDGIVLTGSYNEVNLSGQINALNNGIDATEDEQDVINSGTIQAGLYGIYFASLSFGHVTNTGSIQSDDTGIYNSGGAGFSLDNAGDILGDTALFLSDATAAVVINSGHITGQVEAISIAGTSDAEIHNDGVISTAASGGDAIIVSDATGKLELENLGSVIGNVLGNDLGEVIVNHGVIDGDVLLDDGNDIYRGYGAGYASNGVDGEGGNDTLVGSTFEDTLRGGDGSDVLKGGGGADLLFGDGDADTIYGFNGDDTVYAGTGADHVRLGDGDDTFYDDSETAPDGNDFVLAGRGNDLLSFTSGKNSGYGLLGDDTIVGGSKKDDLRGGDGNDEISGGAGVDEIRGGRGNDTIRGGYGNDEFVFYRDVGLDLITDFSVNSDKIDLDIYQLSGFGDLSTALTTIGTATLLDFSEIGGSGSVLLQNVSLGSLDAADFIF